MQQRSQFYTLQQILSGDLLNAQVFAAQGDSNAMQVILGSTGTYTSNLVVTPTSPASLTLNLSNGFIAQLAVTDASAYGSIPANTDQILQLGYNTVTSVAIDNAGLAPGQAQYVLIEAGFQQQDSDAVVLPYVNISNPAVPLNGPSNSGIAQDTVRNAVANIVVKYGTPATAGSEVPPAPDADYVPVALIDLAYGQVSITGGEILNPNDVAGSAAAPVLAGLLNSHHNGTVGQAPKIILTDGEEVQGLLPMANLFASNTVGGVSAFREGSGNPNGVLAGNANRNGAADTYYDVTNNILYFCTTTGSSSTAVWTNATGNVGANFKTTVMTTSGTYTPSTGAKYATVTIVGGGGSGAGGLVSGPSAQSGGGGGAGAGGVQATILLSSITTPVTVTIGAGGAGVVTDQAGNPGGTTTFGSYMTAYGGGGGSQPYVISGSQGGFGASSLPQAIIAGGASGGAAALTTNAAGTVGGSSAFGIGGGGGNESRGANGPGAGSGGGASANGSSVAGANGICIITEYIGA